MVYEPRVPGLPNLRCQACRTNFRMSNFWLHLNTTAGARRSWPEQSKVPGLASHAARVPGLPYQL